MERVMYDVDEMKPGKFYVIRLDAVQEGNAFLGRMSCGAVVDVFDCEDDASAEVMRRQAAESRDCVELTGPESGDWFRTGALPSSR